MHAVDPITPEVSKVNVDIAKPMWKIILKQFLTHKLAVAGAIVIALFMLISIFAGTIETVTGLDPDEQNVAQRYLPPFTFAATSQDVRETQIERYISADPDSATVIQKALVEKNIISAAEEDAIYELISQSPKDALKTLKDLKLSETTGLERIVNGFETFHLFGTDELGRDVFIRLVYGTRVSMGVGVMVAIASAFIGLLIGSIAGFYGGWIDQALMRITDALLSLPTIPVLIVMAAIDLTKVPILSFIVNTSNESIFKMVVILCIFSWMTVARLIRGSILSIKEREFILAARTLGASDSAIIVRHMFPNVVAPMLVSITLGVGESILFEAALSFLGLGIMPPTPSWGNMLTNAQELIYQAPFLAILPGILILLTTISFNYLGDGLQDAVDPKAIRR